MMDSRILEHPHAQFGGMVGFPYPLGHHHVYELAGHQLQSAAASVPFSIDGLLSGSCAASVVNPAPLIPSGCGVSGDTQPFKLAGRSGPIPSPRLPCPDRRSPPGVYQCGEGKAPRPPSPASLAAGIGVPGGGAAMLGPPRGGGQDRALGRAPGASPLPPAWGHV